MALKDIFKMTKANRYTADGREELIKAQEAEVEDRRYKIGEISEKTGLQKTANGWVKPKSGTGRNHGTELKKRGPGAIHTPGKGSVGMDKMKEAAEKGFKGQELKEFMLGKKAESKPGRDYPILKRDDHAKLAKEVMANGDNWTAEEIAKEWKLGKADAVEVTKAIQALKTHKGVEKTLSNMEQAKKMQAGVEAFLEKKRNAESKPAAEESEFSANDLPEVGQKVTFNWKDKGKTGIKGTVLGFKTINGKTYARVRGEDKSLSPTGEFNVNLQILKSEGPRLNTNKGKTITGNIEQENGIWEPIYGEPADSAPRILTGDTRIRVRK